MHEISLVQGLLDQLDSLARQNEMSRVVKITMDIGPLSGVVVDSFRFGFDILSRDNELVRDAELVINTTPVTYRCTECHTTKQTTGSKPESCPHCGDLFLLAEGGDELVLKTVEME